MRPRYSGKLVKKTNEAIARSMVKSRNAVRDLPELGDNVEELFEKAPVLSDGELEQLGACIFRETSLVRLVAEGRQR